ncbi:MAG TPA: aminotransferase [Deltaproteobacteria bacterium]|nr:MAG: class V aminotransferase [Deltaproteobacteria bacterium GWA2_45_12]HBF13573.1 aminotransferase [Deltaproteobacteria bacterium]
MKYRLYAPGPTPVPEDVLTEMAKPIWHHRTPAFEKVIEEVRAGLKWLFQTKEEVLIFAASGTGAMEGSIVNLMSKGDRALVVDGGKFGERWWKICKAYGLEHDVIKVQWGQAVKASEIEAKLKEKDYRAVFVQASETSTGVAHPIQEIAAIVKKFDQTALVVDGITGVGVFPLPMDQWGIDVLVSGSQKALQLPPGLSFAAVSQKAWGFIEKSDLPKFYFNFKTEKKNILENTTAWTPAVSLIQGLRVVLQNMQKEGLENIFKRHRIMASSVREAAKAVGLKLFAPESPADSITAIYGPEGMNSGDIVKILRNQFNMTIAGGQDAAKGKIFRIGHLGYYDAMDMITVWSAIEMAMAKMGYKFELGKGVARAMEVVGGA